MAANNNESYLGYLNKLADEYSNTYHHSFGKKPIHDDYSASTNEIESSHKAPKLKVGDRVKVSKYKYIFNKGYTKTWDKYSREIFEIDSVFKTNPWRYQVKDLNGKIIIGSFYEKEWLLSIL